jgi:hypothetical protein
MKQVQHGLEKRLEGSMSATERKYAKKFEKWEQMLMHVGLKERQQVVTRQLFLGSAAFHP